MSAVIARPRQYAVSILSLPIEERAAAFEKIPDELGQMTQLHMENFRRQIEPYAQIIARQHPKARPYALEKLADVLRPMVKQRITEISKNG